MFGLFPHSWLVIGASIAFAFMLGMAAGNVHATRTIVAQIQTHEDARFAVVTGEISEELKRRNILVQKDAELARVSDIAALDAMSVDLSKAETARVRALAQLDREHKSKMEIANAYSALAAAHDRNSGNDRCGFSADARRLLNDAAGAIDTYSAAGTSATPAGPPGGPVAADAIPAGPATDSDRLSCDDLYRGYVALGSWAREKAMPRVQAWEAWYRKRFGVQP